MAIFRLGQTGRILWGTALVVVLGTGLALSPGASGVADDASGGLLHNALVRPGETKHPTQDFRRNNAGTSAYEFAFMLYCLSALSINRTQDAIRDCSEAIALDPGNAAAHKLRGMAYFAQHDLGRALADFDRAIALDPNDPEAQGGRGAVFRERGDTASALAAYSRAIELEPRASRWWNARCWTRAVARAALSVALADCNRAIEIDASFVQAYDSRGLVYLQMGNYRRAVTDYTKALHMKPTLATALFGRGVAKLKLADLSGGTDINRARTTDPSIDAKFRSYGIVVNVPKRVLSKPETCGADGCTSVSPPQSLKPPSQNDSEPSRSARVDLNHGAKDRAR